MLNKTYSYEKFLESISDTIFLFDEEIYYENFKNKFPEISLNYWEVVI